MTNQNSEPDEPGYATDKLLRLASQLNNYGVKAQMKTEDSPPSLVLNNGEVVSISDGYFIGAFGRAFSVLSAAALLLGLETEPEPTSSAPGVKWGWLSGDLESRPRLARSGRSRQTSDEARTDQLPRRPCRGAGPNDLRYGFGREGNDNRCVIGRFERRRRTRCLNRPQRRHDLPGDLDRIDPPLAERVTIGPMPHGRFPGHVQHRRSITEPPGVQDFAGFAVGLMAPNPVLINEQPALIHQILVEKLIDVPVGIVVQAILISIHPGSAIGGD